MYPPDRVWRWAGKPCPNRRKRGGRKVFYKSIYRGNEHISVCPDTFDFDEVSQLTIVDACVRVLNSEMKKLVKYVRLFSLV